MFTDFSWYQNQVESSYTTLFPTVGCATVTTPIDESRAWRQLMAPPVEPSTNSTQKESSWCSASRQAAVFSTAQPKFGWARLDPAAAILPILPLHIIHCYIGSLCIQAVRLAELQGLAGRDREWRESHYGSPTSPGLGG